MPAATLLVTARGGAAVGPLGALRRLFKMRMYVMFVFAALILSTVSASLVFIEPQEVAVVVSLIRGPR